jgi:hypothetical protein
MARRQPLELVIGVRVPAPQLVLPVSFSLEHTFAQTAELPCIICSKQHYREWAGMEPLAIAFVVFFFVVIVLGPILGAESRPEFLYPDTKFRKMYGKFGQR